MTGIASLAVLVVAVGLVFPLAALGFSPSQALGAGSAAAADLVFRLVAPQVVDVPGPSGARLPAKQPAVSEQSTLGQLASLSLPKPTRVNAYPVATFDALLKMTAQKPVGIRGRVWKETTAGSRTVLVVDLSGNAFDSKQVLVVLPSSATVGADPTREIQISGLYLSQVTAADRFEQNQTTPVIEAHVVKQAATTLFSAY